MNNIDKLMNEKEELELKKTRIRDKQNKVNSYLETKQKALQDLAYRNKDQADAEISEIERQITKLEKLIKIEVDYATELGTLLFTKKK